MPQDIAPSAKVTIELPDGTTHVFESVPAWAYDWKSKGGPGRAARLIYSPVSQAIPRKGWYLASGTKMGSDYQVAITVMQRREIAPDYVHHYDAVEQALSAETRPDVLQSLRRELETMQVPPENNHAGLFQYSQPPAVAVATLAASPAKSESDNPLNAAPATVAVGSKK